MSEIFKELIGKLMAENISFLIFHCNSGIYKDYPFYCLSAPDWQLSDKNIIFSDMTLYEFLPARPTPVGYHYTTADEYLIKISTIKPFLTKT